MKEWLLSQAAWETEEEEFASGDYTTTIEGL